MCYVSLLLSVDLRKVDQKKRRTTTKIGIKMCVRQRERKKERHSA